MAKVSTTVKGWFRKANDDLIGARSLWDTQNPRLWLLVGYHCQQAAEKAIKGFLLYKGKKFRKVHSIEEISEGVVKEAPELAELLEQAAELTPFATHFRYPDAPVSDKLEKEEIEAALKLAAKVVDEMVSRIPFEGSLDI